jgi:hypothetical protein
VRGGTRLLVVAFAHALALALSILPRWLAEDHVVDQRLGSVLTLVMVAGLAAASIVGTLAPRLPGPLAYPVRAVLAAIALAALSVAFLMGFFAIEFWWNAYGENQPLWTTRGLLQFGFTSAQGAFYFGVFGLRLFWPWGLLPPILAALVLARPETRP